MILSLTADLNYQVDIEGVWLNDRDHRSFVWLLINSTHKKWPQNTHNRMNWTRFNSSSLLTGIEQHEMKFNDEVDLETSIKI